MPYKFKYAEFYRGIAARDMAIYNAENNTWVTANNMRTITAKVNNNTAEATKSTSMAEYEMTGKVKGSILQPYQTLYMWKRTA